MHVMITLLFALSGAQAANDTADNSCSDWGDIAQDDSIVDVVQAGDGEILLNVSSPSCGETEECVWTLQGGTSQQAPGRIYNCGEAGEGGSTATGAVRLDSADHLAPEPVCWLARVLRADQRAEPSNNFVGVTLRGSAPVLPGPVSHAVRQARERASSRGPHA